MHNHSIRLARAYPIILSAVLISSVLTACLPPDMQPVSKAAPASPQDTPTPQPQTILTADPTRPAYQPGELVDYTAQAGDTLVAIAAHFNTTVKEIRAANTFIPSDATTMPPGMPMKIPIYYEALWGSSYQILPDSHFVNGPAVSGFDAPGYVRKQPGWLKDYLNYTLDKNRDGGEVVDYVSTNYSVSPRLLLALIEFQLGGLSQSEMPDSINDGYPLGNQDTSATGLYRQIAWAANTLNTAYYSWRTGTLKEFVLQDGSIVRPDPWQNAASVALQYYFSLHGSVDDYRKAISPTGFAATYQRLFGNPWTTKPHIPGSLTQPFMRLPFAPGALWAFTGGPHNPWGTGVPFAALDFAPPLVVGGCTSTDLFATAVADGVIVRTGQGIVVLDLDGDGDERTGWVVFYLHLEDRDKITVGKHVKAGDPLGHPSCEGGEATGTHVHMARKYNGEWIPADGIVPYKLDNWTIHSSSTAYQGYMERNGITVTACTCSDNKSQLESDPH